MFCPYCGTQSKAAGAMFCSACGKPLNTVIEAPNSQLGALATTGQVTHRPWLAWPFWLLAICVLGSCSGLLLLLLSGREQLPPGTILGAFVWPGALVAYVWKKLGRSGWVGFGLGALLGATFMMLASFGTGYYRARQAAAEEAKWEDLPTKPLPPGFEYLPENASAPK